MVSRIFPALLLLMFVVSAYEPPPDIGGPKRTGGSGGRYVPAQVI